MRAESIDCVEDSMVIDDYDLSTTNFHLLQPGEEGNDLSSSDEINEWTIVRVERTFPQVLPLLDRLSHGQLESHPLTSPSLLHLGDCSI